MDITDILGMTAGGLTTVSFLPQVIKTWKSKSAADISSGMFVLFSSGVFLWLLYGLAIGASPIIIANAVTLALALLILILKLHYQRRR
jgi:MtN3 and saliva related transmembrane protein